MHYDANLSDKERKGAVKLSNGEIKREVIPQSINLGHELIHSDHFHRGLGAYDEKGMPILSFREHTYVPTRGEYTDLEEMNAVGLETLPLGHEFHQDIAGLNSLKTYQKELQERDILAREITEQMLRSLLGISPRAGYER